MPEATMRIETNDVGAKSSSETAYRLGGAAKGILRPLADGVIVGGFGLAILPWGNRAALGLLALQVVLSILRIYDRFAAVGLAALAASLMLYWAADLPPSAWEAGLWASVLIWGVTDERGGWARPLAAVPVALIAAGMFGVGFGDTTPLVGRGPSVGNHADELLRVALLLFATFIGPILRKELAKEKEGRTAAVEEAATAERARIARELHDVVSHHVTVMVLQAEGARAASTDSSATTALAQVITSGRTALTELRRLLGVLRQPDAAAEPELEPQPDLDQLPALLEQLRGAGLDVDLTVVGEPWTVQPGVGLSAYRIVQEALTNTLRHSGGEVAHIQLTYAPDALHVEVSDDGGSRRRLRGGSGTGLIGMQERAAAVGGTVEAGPVLRGGYAVVARLPRG